MMAEMAVQAQRVTIQEAVILGQQQQITNLKEINLTKDGIIIVSDKEVAYWKKQYRKQKRQKILIGVGSAIVVIVSLLGSG